MITIRDIDIKAKRVILRLDLNVPIKDGKIEDDTRIINSLKTFNYIEKQAKQIIILSHLGRVKTKEDKENNSLRIVCDYYSNLINKNISFYDYTNDEVLNDRIIMFENTRFFDLDNEKESKNDSELAKFFASFGDVFVNDAFGCIHRCNASNVGITKYLPSCNGFLVEEEINNLERLVNNPEHPFYIIMGGKKVSDKIGIINNLINKCDKLFVGGAMVYTFLKAKNIEVGSSFIEEEYIDMARKLLEKYGNKLVLIEDNFIKGKTIKNINEMNKDDIGLDIGPNTIEKFKKELSDSKTIFINGPMGLFEEEYDFGTKELLTYISKLNSYVVVGGGDTVNAVNKYVKNNNFIISTGGGATLEFLEGKKLPGVIL